MIASNKYPTPRFTPIVEREAPNVLFGHADARATHFLWDVSHLWQPVLHSQLRLFIVDMDAGVVWKVWNDCRVDVGESPAGMLGEDVAPTGLTPFAITERSLVVRADVVCSLRELYRFGFP